MVAPQKTKLVKEIDERLEKANSFFLVNFKSLKANDMNFMRKEFRRSQAEVAIIKNRLLKIALKNRSIEFPEEHYRNETAVVFCNDDPIKVAKLIKKYIKAKYSIAVKAGYFENRVIDDDEFKQLASILSREELLSKLVGSLMSPLTKFCICLKNPTTKLVIALRQIIDTRSN